MGSSARCPPPCPSNLSVHPSALCRGPRPGPSLPGQMAEPFLPEPVAGEALRSRLASRHLLLPWVRLCTGRGRAGVLARAAPRRETVASSGQFPEFTAFPTSP